MDTSSQHTIFLTSGPRVVRRILAWDQVTSHCIGPHSVTSPLIGQDNTGLVYLLGTAAGRPGSLHLYTVPAEGGDTRQIAAAIF